MTTAVRPSNAQNWGEVFNDLPEEGSHWRTINTLLEAFAMDARFGFKGMPHDFIPMWTKSDKCSKCDAPKEDHPIELTDSERIFQMYFHSWQDSPNILDIKPFGTDEEKERAKSVMENLGEVVWYLLRLSKAEPVVGHFVGRGFDQNNEDADVFLGNT